MTQHGTCPECEFEFTAQMLEEGETIVCPECMLTLQVMTVQDGQLGFETVAATLPDWGQ
jgi:alpha-aminoadipate carrier protein LysW